jgi:HTH-type transcriptional regulator / antitoxin HigA
MTSDFQPDWASPPGDTIADILRERNLSREQFAAELQRTPKEVNELLCGQLIITLELARRLERTLGASRQFWMSRDFYYREDLARREQLAKQWLSDLPIQDMISFGWLRSHPTPNLTSCLKFFDVPDVATWNDRYAELQQVLSFRTSAAFQSKPAAVAAWLRQGEIEATETECNEWNAERFQHSLPELRRLTREKEPRRFLPALKRVCAESGVAVVTLRAPSGCRASGATRFLSPTKAILMLSFRHLSDDHLWFTFFHEAGHLLLHGKKRFFLEADEVTATTEEREADRFAASTLVPPEFQDELLKLRPTHKAVIRFAMHVGIAPGIVVGQLQHLRHIRYNQLNRLKRRYDWES